MADEMNTDERAQFEWDDFDAHWSTWDGGFTPENPPTHWQPLPASPTIEGEINV